MSLVERVRRANVTNQPFVEQGQTQRLGELKYELHRRISSDDIASVVAENPLRARNEIRSICLGIFEDKSWSMLSSEEKDGLIEELIDAIFGLGPLETLLKDEEVTEIMVNGSQAVFFEKQGKLFPSRYTFADDDQVRALIDRIIGPLGRRIDESSPMVNARLEQGHRVNAIIPPLAIDGPILTIRKFREHLYTLEEMAFSGSLDEGVRQFLTWAVLLQKNIAVSGGTGSGKTTLLNALSCVIPPEERIITIEDSAELKFSHHPHVVRLEARPRNAEGIGEIEIRDLVINALRMRPDRIIVGECRGGEALDMLQAMNTGHDGSLTTLHANSPSDAVMRLATMVRYAADIPIDVIRTQITSAIDIIVQITRAVDGRRYVQEIAVLDEVGSTPDRFRVLYRRSEEQSCGRWLAFPDWLVALPGRNIASQEEVGAWKREASLPA